MQVQAEGEEVHPIDAGGFDGVEPGDTHRDTALVDALLLVICEEDRPALRPGPTALPLLLSPAEVLRGSSGASMMRSQQFTHAPLRSAADLR
jgi:hypothetical protein